MEGSVHGLIMLISKNLPGETEENSEKHLNRQCPYRTLPEYMYTDLPLLRTYSEAHLLFIYFLRSFFKSLKLCLSIMCALCEQGSFELRHII